MAPVRQVALSRGPWRACWSGGEEGGGDDGDAVAAAAGVGASGHVLAAGMRAAEVSGGGVGTLTACRGELGLPSVFGQAGTTGEVVRWPRRGSNVTRRISSACT